MLNRFLNYILLIVGWIKYRYYKKCPQALYYWITKIIRLAVSEERLTIQHINDGVYIGDVNSLDEKEARQANNIGAVINCAKELYFKRFIPNEVEHFLFLDLDDGEAIPEHKISSAIHFIDIARNKGLNVMVSCAAGASRSASIILAYMISTGWDFDEALKHMQKVRPIINPSIECLDSIKEYFGIPTYGDE